MSVMHRTMPSAPFSAAVGAHGLADLVDHAECAALVDGLVLANEQLLASGLEHLDVVADHLSAAVKEPDGRVRKTSMPNLTGSTPTCSPSLAATARSTSVVVGLLSMSVSVIMAESSSLA